MDRHSLLEAACAYGQHEGNHRQRRRLAAFGAIQRCGTSRAAAPLADHKIHPLHDMARRQQDSLNNCSLPNGAQQHAHACSSLLGACTGPGTCHCIPHLGKNEQHGDVADLTIIQVQDHINFHRQEQGVTAMNKVCSHLCMPANVLSMSTSVRLQNEGRRR